MKNKKITKILFLLLFCYLFMVQEIPEPLRKSLKAIAAGDFLNFSSVFAEGTQSQAPVKAASVRGIWVSVFSAKKVLYSKEGVDQLIAQCKKAKINEIYLQVYQSGNAYYDSKICDRTKYDAMVKAAGIDTLDLLLREAQENKINVFAWVNVLSLGNNDKADILNKYGNSILTRDQYQRPSKTVSSIELDKYYLRENMIFLEPGDPRVEEYVLTIINEIINRYPLISGIHLDYLRYPSPVPFAPDQDSINLV